jgi:hypothetical protein
LRLEGRDADLPNVAAVAAPAEEPVEKQRAFFIGR